MMAKQKKPRGKTRTILPVMVVGGIDANRAYSVPEFMAITRVTRQALSRMRREENGLVIRDCGGSPQILGQDWLDYLERAPRHVAKQRRPAGIIAQQQAAKNGKGHP